MPPLDVHRWMIHCLGLFMAIACCVLNLSAMYGTAVAKAKEMRKLLSANRLEPEPPSLLLYIFRVLFKCHFGQLRLLICHVYGLYADIVRKECRMGINVQRALSIFVAEGLY